MARQAPSPTDGSLRTLADTAAECTSLLPTALALYAEDDPGFEDLVDRVMALESRCDRRVRTLRSELGAAEPAFADSYLYAPDVLELAYEVDRVASEAEQFLAELRAVEPGLSPGIHAGMVEHARRSAAACDRLSSAVEAALADEPCEDHVDVVRAAESACERLKYELLGDVDGPPGRVVLVREFAVTLDAVPNAVEDAADRLGQLRAGRV